MHRSFLASRSEGRIRIGTAVTCLLLVLHGIAPGQGAGAESLPRTLPSFQMNPETSPAPDQAAPDAESMPDEAPSEEKPAGESGTPAIVPAQPEPTPPPAEPTPPWSNSGAVNQTLFGPPLSGLGVNSRLTVNPSRPSVARIYSGQQNRLESGNDPYNLKVGRLKFRFSTGLRLEANDNINLSTTNRQADFIVQPAIGVQGTWRLTKVNSLSIRVTFGKSFYLNHPEKNQTNLQIAPGSQIALNVYAGDFRFGFHDRFSVEQDPIAVSGLSNTTNAGLFTNDAGLAVTWDLNALILNMELDHTNFNSIQSQPNYPNRAVNSLALFATTAINRAVNVGAESGVSQIAYSGRNQTLPPDVKLGFAGLFTEGRMTRFITLRAGAGGQLAFLDSTASKPASRQQGWYANLIFSQLLNPWCNQTLDIGHEIVPGLYSSAEENTYLRHSMSFKVFRRASLSTQLAVEKVSTPGATLNSNSNYTSYGGGIQWNYQFTKKLSLDTQYQFVYKVTNVLGQNYTQNRLVLDFAYQF